MSFDSIPRHWLLFCLTFGKKVSVTLDLLHFQIEKFYKCGKDSVLVEQGHILSTHLQTFRVGLTFKPATYKNGLILYYNREMYFLWVKSGEETKQFSKKFKLTQNSYRIEAYRPGLASLCCSETKFKTKINISDWLKNSYWVRLLKPELKLCQFKVFSSQQNCN